MHPSRDIKKLGKMKVVFREERTLISVGTCSLGVSSPSRQSSPQKTRIEMMMAKSLIRVRIWSTFRESRGEENMGEDILVQIWRFKVWITSCRYSAALKDEAGDIRQL